MKLLSPLRLLLPFLLLQACEYRADLRGSKYSSDYLQPTQAVQTAVVGEAVALVSHVRLADGKNLPLVFGLPKGGCAKLQGSQLVASCAEPLLVTAHLADDPRTLVTWTVQVRPAQASLKVVVDRPEGGAALVLKAGERGQVRGSVEASDGQVSGNVLYASSDLSIATVDADGAVQALKEGRATISISAVADPQAVALVQLRVTE